MYCKNCGKEIAEDSIFCKYCGKNIGEEKSSSRDIGFFNKFRGLSSWKQITIIVYCIWILVWICILLANANEDYFAENFVLPFFICTIVVPFVIVGIWHIYKLRSRNKTQNKTTEAQQEDLNQIKSSLVSPEVKQDDVIEDAHNTIPPIFSSESLLSFAKNNGKMQVVNKKLAENNFENYCQFVSDDGKVLRVDFSENIGPLTSKEISSRKSLLAVNKYPNGSYYLDYIENAQIEDSLPF